MAKSRDFADEYDEQQSSDVNLSDADLEALMAGHAPVEASAESGSDYAGGLVEAGTVVEGLVFDFQGGELMVELDSKTVGIVDEAEFEGETLPAIGTRLQAQFMRYDRNREIAVLAVREARREIFWDDVQPGTVVEGRVIEVNKGGLTVNVNGNRAFMPISQIERHRVEDASTYVGTSVVCEITQVNRENRDLVVSRRVVLDRQAEEQKSVALARLSEGEVLKGTVASIKEHLGAFIDLGGVEGLLHESKIHAHYHELGEEKKLYVGQQIEVEIARLDRERERISLDFHRVAGDSWNKSVESYRVGDEATGWVTRIVEQGAYVSLDEDVEGLLPRSVFATLPEDPTRGSVLRVGITRIDVDAREIELQMLGDSE
ncbi:MAG: S1 RNA-binding domain-containing protein [Planctomycetota bacterium]